MQVIGVLYGEQDGVNALGDVAFIMGLPHSFAAKARTTGSATLLTITSAVFDKLLAPFPESKEQITGNLLEEYDMDRQGRVVHQEKQSLDEQTRKERREIINMIQVPHQPDHQCRNVDQHCSKWNVCVQGSTGETER